MLQPRTIGVFVCVTALSLLSWFWAVPAVMSRTTFAFLAVFVLGGAAVALMTWRNAQATASTAQLLQATEVAAASRDARDSSPRS